MRSLIISLVVVVVLFGFCGLAMANSVIPGSTHFDSVVLPNFYISWGVQRYGGDGADFAHSWFDISTPFQINVGQWSSMPPTAADPTHWSTSLSVRGLEIPTAETSWGVPNEFYFGDIRVAQNILDYYSYGWNHFSGYVDVWSSTAEFSLPTLNFVEYQDGADNRFAADFTITGNLLASQTPEPSTTCLLMMGLVTGLIVLWRKKRQ